MRRLSVLILMLLVVTQICLAREIVVNSTANSGTGTLRWALQTARHGDVITFDPDTFPPGKPATIYPSTELPPITCGGLTIDASDAGVVLDGSRIREDWIIGLQFYSDSNIVKGLRIRGFAGAGIAVAGSHNVIGGDPAAQEGNVVYGNGFGIGLWDSGTAHNTIMGNTVGLEELGNSQHGVWITEGANRNIVGPNNVIAFNGGAGVSIEWPTSTGNIVTEDSIHDNATGIYVASGENGQVMPPVLVTLDLASGWITGWACSDCTVELFSGSSSQGVRYEGTTIADEAGWFSMDLATPLRGPLVTSTATHPSLGTSAFSVPTSTTLELQGGNVDKGRPLETRSAAVLDDNRIAQFPEVRYLDFQVTDLLNTGYKWQRLELLKNDIYGGEFWQVDWTTEAYAINREDDLAITQLAVAGVSLTAALGCQIDEEGFAERGHFKTEDELEQFHSYVRSVVRQFRDRIAYYEIWNEPDVRTPNWYVELPDYIRLVARTIPVIREEYPEARIVVGSTSYLWDPESNDYLFGLLKQAEIMSDVDVVSWHPMYGTSPEYGFCREYYYDYPDIVRRIQEVARAHGFEGDFHAAEINWMIPKHPEPLIATQPRHPELVAAKYYARGIVLHLALDVVAGIIDWGDNPSATRVIANLCSVMAGHEAIDIPVEIGIDFDGPVAYCAFRYPNGDRTLAVWTDGIAQDEDPGVPTAITFPDLVAETVTGIDVLHGFEQELVFETDGDGTIVRDLLVKDYPILIRLSDVTMSSDYAEIVGDGFHHLGEPAASAVSDRDGDGVPDHDDYCPDWPGSPETNGC